MAKREDRWLVACGCRIVDESICGGLYGFIDPQGNPTIPPRHRLTHIHIGAARPFRNGVAYIPRNDGWERVDAGGNILSVHPKTEMENLIPLADDLFGVMVYGRGDIRRGFIDGAGQWVKPLGAISSFGQSFREGLLWVGDPSADCYGFMDEHARWVIEPQFRFIGDFREGLAGAVRKETEPENQYGFIDTTGHWAISPQFYGVHEFSDGVAAVTVRRKSKKDEQYLDGLIDRSGQWLMEPQTRLSFYYSPFSEGLIAFKDYTAKKHGFVNRSGEVVIPAQWDEVGPFTGGRAFVKRGDLWGLIDREGRQVLEPSLLGLDNFTSQRQPFAEHALTPARAADGRWGFLNADGVWHSPPRFEYMEYKTFDGSFVLAQIGDVTTWIDTKGEPLWMPSDALRVTIHETLVRDIEPPSRSAGLAPAVRKELERLGAKPSTKTVIRSDLDPSVMPGALPDALRELLFFWTWPDKAEWRAPSCGDSCYRGKPPSPKALPDAVRKAWEEAEPEDLSVLSFAPGACGGVSFCPMEHEGFADLRILIVGGTDSQAWLGIDLDDPKPRDPTVYWIDHDDFESLPEDCRWLPLSRVLAYARVAEPES